MTTIIGIKAIVNGKPEVMVASDSRCTLGNEILSVEERKIVEFPNFVVLYTGLATISHAVKDLAKDKAFLRQSFMKMKTPEDASEFHRSVMTNLKLMLENSADPNSGCDSRILVCTPTNVFSVDAYFFAFDTHLLADGSGGTWAQSWLEGVYNEIMTIEDMEREVRKAMKIACKKDTGTGGKIHLLHVKQDSLPKQPITKKIVRKKKVSKSDE